MHATLDETHTVPLAYCITGNKSQATYASIFNTLKLLRPYLNPVSVAVDYEKVVLIPCFPNTNIYGCFFSFWVAYGEHKNDLENTTRI